MNQSKVIYVDEKIHKKAKIEAAKLGITLKDYVDQLLQKAVAKAS